MKNGTSSRTRVSFNRYVNLAKPLEASIIEAALYNLRD